MTAGALPSAPAAGPVPAMVCIALSAACLMGGYEFARSPVASLFIEAFGAGRMPYAMTIVPVFMAVLIYFYARILTRLGSLWTLQVSLGLSAAAFLAAYAALCSGWKPAVAAIYIFTEAYIVILVEQFWSFINSTLDQAQAKAFNGPILAGATVGSLLADLAVNRFASVLGSQQFLLLAGAALVPAAVLAYVAYGLAGEPRPTVEERRSSLGPLRLRLILDHKVLLFMAAVVALSQFFAVATNQRFYELLEVARPNQDARSAYLGIFWVRVNGLAILMQCVATPYLLRRLPLAVILVSIPLVHVCTAGLMLVDPSLVVTVAALLIFKTIDYSLFRASKELLYIPLSFDARFRAKQVVDSFNYRFSKGAAAGCISLAKLMLGTLPGWTYPALSLGAAGAWVAAAVPLARKAQEGASPDLAEGGCYE